ncbi:MAG: AAA family ATPase [Dehalococcoidales bacterium]|nr:AAA family ATPase [Dehalococcoidales bacterium]
MEERPRYHRVITDDLDAFFNILPPYVKQPLQEDKESTDLIEVVLDLGRPPEARFPRRESTPSEVEVSQTDIDYVTSHIGQFGDDNRAGIERTLHRISAIRNRKGRIVGLTCRVGRAVFGTIKIIEDLVESGKSVLLLGRPGIGKTTMLREVARVLADNFKKRVVIVDTSNEIAGDGDIPHPAIGRARRMQVKTPNMQHAVMIEAVENHMPEVIVIDEIGTELEAQAARTIAERGVQLVGTAHGNTLENLMLNPTLSDLIGGIQSVTLSDEEARHRGTQKSVLERKAPPTFDIVVEIIQRDRVAIHPDVAQAIDMLLRDEPSPLEIRWQDENGEVIIEKQAPKPNAETAMKKHRESAYRLFLFGVNRNRIEQMADEMGLDVNIAGDVDDANLFITSKQYYRRKPQKLRDAENANLPVYVLKNNTPGQIRQLLRSIYPNNGEEMPREKEAASFGGALHEAEDAVHQVTDGAGAIELSPQSAYIRRLQHLIAERHDMPSKSTGKDPKRRVVIYRDKRYK